MVEPKARRGDDHAPHPVSVFGPVPFMAQRAVSRPRTASHVAQVRMARTMTSVACRHRPPDSVRCTSARPGRRVTVQTRGASRVVHGVIEMDRHLLRRKDDLARTRRVAGGPRGQHPRGSGDRRTGVGASALPRDHGCRRSKRHAGKQPCNLGSDRLHRFTNNCNEARMRYRWPTNSFVSCSHSRRVVVSSPIR